MLTIKKPCNVTMLTFGGKQTFVAPAGKQFIGHDSVVQMNESYIVLQFGLNYYVFETHCVDLQEQMP